MLLKINPINSIKNRIYKPENHNNEQRKVSFNNISTKTKVLTGISALAIMGAASVGLAVHKCLKNVKNINEIKYIGQSIANHAVKSSGTRSEYAVNLYNAHIADKKADVLKYKIEHGMFFGKTQREMAHIRNNLKNLELDAII